MQFLSKKYDNQLLLVYNQNLHDIPELSNSHESDKYIKAMKHIRSKPNNSYRNMYTLKKLIFPPIAEDKIDRLMIDNESIKLITYASSAQEITNIIMNNLIDFPCPAHIQSNETRWTSMHLAEKMRHLVISDMTAGVGGNVLNFASNFKYVNAVEIDSIRYNYLNKNVKLYNFVNVNCYNADSYNLLVEQDIISQDIVFFDPPWGGINYKTFSSLRLYFGIHTIENVCKKILAKTNTKMIIIKLPKNYEMEYMKQELKEYRFCQIVLERMIIVVIKNYN